MLCLRRCTSVRGDQHVLTHMLVSPAKMLTKADVNQLLGRPLGHTEELRKGIPVCLLTTQSAFELAHKLYAFTLERLSMCGTGRLEDVDRWKTTECAAEYMEMLRDPRRVAPRTYASISDAFNAIPIVEGAVPPARPPFMSEDPDAPPPAHPAPAAATEESDGEDAAAAAAPALAEGAGAAGPADMATFINDDPEEVAPPPDLDEAKVMAWARRQQDKARVLLAVMADVAENGVVTLDDVVADHPVARAVLPDEVERAALDAILRQAGLVEMAGGDTVRRLTPAGTAEFERIKVEVEGEVPVVNATTLKRRILVELSRSATGLTFAALITKLPLALGALLQERHRAPLTEMSNAGLVLLADGVWRITRTGMQSI